ncbi:MAG: hypothetical protein ACLR23_14640 [Clostridia bacterium]
MELYKFCISLQNTFSHDFDTALFAGGQSIDLAGQHQRTAGQFCGGHTGELQPVQHSCA